MAYKPRKDIKVPESYIQKLRDTGSKKAALEKYGKSSDPKMREALRRFYGASAPAPMKDSSRAIARTLPKKSIPMGKTVSQAKPKASVGSRDSGPVVQNRRSAAPTTKAPNREAANKAAANKAAGNKRALQIASMVPVVRGAMLGKAAYSAAAKQVGVANIKKGVKNKVATKGELSEARSMARGMVKDTAKLKSKTATTKAKTAVKTGASKASGADKIKNANAIRRASKAGK
jgi:hypothetical protein